MESMSNDKSWIKRASNWAWYGSTEGRTETRSGSIDSAGGTSPLPGVIPAPRTWSNEVSADEALSVGVVYRAVSYIVGSVAQMELQVKRGNKVITTPAIIKQPNYDQTRKTFIELTTYSLVCYGNAYWSIQRNSAGNVNNIEVIDPRTISITRDDNNKKVYWVGNTKLVAGSFKHLRLLSDFNDKSPGPIQAANKEIRALIALREFADTWFDGPVPTGGILKVDRNLNEDESQALIEAWTAFVQRNKALILPQGTSYETLKLKPADAQFLELQNAAVVGMARLFGVPALQILAEMSGTSNTYTNIQESNLMFVQGTLVSYMNEIEDALSSLVPGNTAVKFNQEDLLRTDTLTRTNIRKLQIESGIRTANEIREEDGLDPLEAPVAPVVQEEEVTVND